MRNFSGDAPFKIISLWNIGFRIAKVFNSRCRMTEEFISLKISNYFIKSMYPKILFALILLTMKKDLRHKKAG